MSERRVHTRRAGREHAGGVQIRAYLGLAQAPDDGIEAEGPTSDGVHSLHRAEQLTGVLGVGLLDGSFLERRCRAEIGPEGRDLDALEGEGSRVEAEVDGSRTPTLTSTVSVAVLYPSACTDRVCRPAGKIIV